jgi:phosphatidylserine decarboxylase
MPRIEHQDDVIGVVTLEIIGAENLPNPPRKYRGYRRVNPFAIISYGRQAFRTNWLRSTTEPKWNEAVHLKVRRSELEKYLIVFSVYDYDRMGYNAYLATTNVRIQYFCERPGEQINLALELQNETNSDCFLFLKGMFRSIASLEDLFWENLMDSSQESISKDECERVLRSVGLESQILIRSYEQRELKIILQSQKRIEKCPVCHRIQTGNKGFIHSVICSYEHHYGNLNWSSGGYVTEEYASRKWFSRVLGMLGFGGYRIGHNNGQILVQERRTGRIIEERIPMSIRLAIRWMHQNIVNRQAIDWPLIRSLFHTLTLRQGALYNDPQSTRYILDFIKYYKLSIDEIEQDIGQFKNFNEFFYRKLKAGARQLASPIDDRVMVSPADCRMHCFPKISDAIEFWIKGKNFTIKDLLGEQNERRYLQGSLAICRLAPQDYHRFHSPVDGVISAIEHLPGAYFTVNPMAVRQNLDIFTENTRTVLYIDSVAHGRVAFVAIGAMMVGSIIITCEQDQRVKRMDEIGYFAFGGSTIVLVVEPGGVSFDKDLLENSCQPIETLVQVGEQIGINTH